MSDYRNPADRFIVDKAQEARRASMVGFRLRDAWEECRFVEEEGAEKCGKTYYPHSSGTSPYCADCTPLAQIKALSEAHKKQHDEIIELRKQLDAIKEVLQ